MNSKEVKYLTEAYSNLYSKSETDCQELYDSVLELCIVDGGFTTLEECENFAEFLVADNLVEDFITTLLEYYEVENLNESFEFLGENRAAALRSVINALSSGGRLKAGLRPLTAIGRRPETVVRGAAASTTIRSARAQRTPTPSPQESGKYVRLLQQRTTPKPLSTQGQEIKDYNKMMGGGLTGTSPTPKPSGAPGLGDPIKNAFDFGKNSKEAQRLAVRAQRMAKNNYGKLLKTPLGKAVATVATAGLAAGAASLGKKNPAVKSNPTDSVGKYNTKTRSEEFDYFDIVMEHLISEGYADTNEAAIAIMGSMSEEWRVSIVEQSEPVKQNYRSYDRRDRGGSEEDHKKALELQNLIRSVQGNSVKKTV